MLTFLLCILFVIPIHSQLLEGKVLDHATQESLPGATIYLDGTTISTITDADGNFQINTRNNNSTMVVSYVGYTTQRIENPLQYAHTKLKILLAEQSINLNEVVVGKGPFSRKQMMEAFKHQFLGQSKSAQSCKIINEEDIILQYDVRTNSLNASGQNPIRIKNDHLSYEVNFDLIEFVANYRIKSLNVHDLQKSYFSGTTFYKDLSKNKKADKKRMEKFYGNSYHFMHTLANDTWEKEGMSLYVDRMRVNPKEYFRITDTLGLKKVTLIKEPERTIYLQPTNSEVSAGNITISKTDSGQIKKEPTYFNILYQKGKQSIMQFAEKDIYVDDNGNYTPLYGVLFGGYLGTLKAGDMLPTDYYQTIKEMQKD